MLNASESEYTKSFLEKEVTQSHRRSIATDDIMLPKQWHEI